MVTERVTLKKSWRVRVRARMEERAGVIVGVGGGEQMVAEQRDEGGMRSTPV